MVGYFSLKIVNLDESFLRSFLRSGRSILPPSERMEILKFWLNFDSYSFVYEIGRFYFYIFRRNLIFQNNQVIFNNEIINLLTRHANDE